MEQRIIVPDFQLLVKQPELLKPDSPIFQSGWNVIAIPHYYLAYWANQHTEYQRAPHDAINAAIREVLRILSDDNPDSDAKRNDQIGRLEVTINSSSEPKQYIYFYNKENDVCQNSDAAAIRLCQDIPVQETGKTACFFAMSRERAKNEGITNYLKISEVKYVVL